MCLTASIHVIPSPLSVCLTGPIALNVCRADDLCVSQSLSLCVLAFSIHLTVCPTDLCVSPFVLTTLVQCLSFLCVCVICTCTCICLDPLIQCV